MKRQGLLLALMLASTVQLADAADSDTRIGVSYATRFRTTTTPVQTVQGIVDAKFVLRANGTVDDAMEVRGGAKGTNKSKLGGERNRVTYRVIDQSTIERVADQGNYLLRITVRVNGKYCSAEVERQLKAGQKQYRVWSEGQKRWVMYRSAEPFWATCTIE